MADRVGLVHAMLVHPEGADGEVDVEWFHPEGCDVSVSTVRDPQFGNLYYECAVAAELRNAGHDAFPEGLPPEPGFYLVEAWHEVIHDYIYGDEHNGGLSVLAWFAPAPAQPEKPGR